MLSLSPETAKRDYCLPVDQMQSTGGFPAGSTCGNESELNLSLAADGYCGHKAPLLYLADRRYPPQTRRHFR